MADCCSEIKVAMDRTATADRTFTEHERVNREEFGEVWAAINVLRNRLPNWAVFVISFLVGAVGWLAKGATITGG